MVVKRMTTQGSLNITKLLHSVIDLELAVDDAKELMIGPEARQQTIFAQLDLKLSEFAKTAGWLDVLNAAKKGNHAELTQVYVQALALFLLLSAKRQLTHLVVMSDDQWERIVSADKKERLTDLNREYLAVKNFLNGAYFSRCHEDFRHAWHLFLKMGIVDFEISPEEITSAYQEMITNGIKQFAGEG